MTRRPYSSNVATNKSNLTRTLPTEQLRYLLIVLAGTLLRFIWANKAQPWLSSIDNIVWVTILNNPSPGIRLDQLIHYPHEAASLIYSLSALLLP
jgi:hypothetical protein